MQTRLTIDVDSDTLKLAQEQAQTRGTTVQSILSSYLEVMAANRRDSACGKTPITDSLGGIVKLPKSANIDELLAEARLEKLRCP